MDGAPRAEYERRLAARRAEAERLAARRRLLSHARLAFFALAVALGWWLLASGRAPFAWVVLPLGAFAALVLLHDRARHASRVAERVARFYEHGLARLAGRFAGRGRSGQEFADPHHPYVDHLDLFGVGSLFELLCRSQTQAGAETLASWLRRPGPPTEVRERQAAVGELRPALDLREDLVSLGPEVREAVDGSSLRSWALGEPSFRSPALRGAALALAATTAGTLALGGLSEAGFGPFALAVALQSGFALLLRARVDRTLRGIEGPGQELALLAELLGRLEREEFAAPRLVWLKERLSASGHTPSREIARLRQLLDLLDARRNQLFAPLSPLLLWRTQLGLAIDAWRGRCGASVPGWLATVGELEALLDLASHAYEHPDDPFPELVDLADGPLFEGTALGHPMLGDESSVRNDLRLCAELRLLVISGSNMSGKSTLLRTVGTNAVMALAGAPVRAESLRLSPLALGATLRIHDSLAEGASRFYAEITCLRRVIDLLDGELPVLFLLDEILAGTNSHDRGIGATAVLRSLVERGGIGLVTTHDLALTKLVDELAPRAANVHFQDELIGGEMVFDYRLHEGVVRKSNAIALMRAVGLEV